MSSTRDGFSCGENRSAAGATRPSILGCRRAAGRNRAAGPRFSARSPSFTPPSADELDERADFFALFCGFCQKLPKIQSGANFQQKIANWRFSASFADFFLRFSPDWPEDGSRLARGSRTGGRDPSAPDRTPGAPVDRVNWPGRSIATGAPRRAARAASKR